MELNYPSRPPPPVLAVDLTCCTEAQALARARLELSALAWSVSREAVREEGRLCAELMREALSGACHSVKVSRGQYVIVMPDGKEYGMGRVVTVGPRAATSAGDLSAYERARARRAGRAVPASGGGARTNGRWSFLDIRRLIKMNVHSGSISLTSAWVPAPSTARGSALKLSASPDGTKISYGSGRNAILRPINGEGPTIIYGHAQNVNVSKILTPYYVASGDSSGTVKVWDATGNTVEPKFEFKPISKINDIAVDGEGKRLVVVGEGRGAFGATFSLDTGSSIGEISGSSKTLNAVAMRPGRPFRAVTGGDDFSVSVLNGVPFKWASKSTRHTRFVQALDYAPDGALFLSAASDGQVLLYDGTTGEDKGALVMEGTQAAHSAGVFGASFSRDGKQVVTSAADRTVKLWDVATGKVAQSWTFEGDNLLQQQVGNVFASASTIVSASLSGDLNVLDPRSATPTATLYGHQQPVTALAYEAESNTFWSGDSAGQLRLWEGNTASPLDGSGHAANVVGLAKVGKSELVSASFDDSVKTISGKSFGSTALSTGGQPKSIAASGSAAFVVTGTTLQKIDGSAKGPSATVNGALSVAVDGDLVAVGTETKALLFKASDLSTAGEIDVRSPATAVALSGTKLAVGLSTGKIGLYDAVERKLLHSRWVENTAKIHALAWNASGSHLASAGLDESVRVFSVEKPAIVLSAKNAHRGGVSSVVWVSDGKLATAGFDGAIKHFDVAF